MSKRSQAAMEFLMYKIKNFMPRNSKSQAAMEFLMTYGWALLVVLIAFAALIFVGIMSPSRNLPEMCQLSVGMPCLSFTAESNGDEIIGREDRIIIIIKSDMIKNMRNFVINISGCAETSNATDIRKGQTKKIIVTNCSLVPEERFRGDLHVTYDRQSDQETFIQSKTGYIHVTVTKT